MMSVLAVVVVAAAAAVLCEAGKDDADVKGKVLGITPADCKSDH
jgi:hypothetical protein